jgi:hypothetical protein
MREIAGKVNVACKRGFGIKSPDPEFWPRKRDDMALPSIFFKFLLDYFFTCP